MAHPNAGASGHSVTITSQFVTSACICSQNLDRVAPPAMTMVSIFVPFFRMVSTTALVPKHIDSNIARNMCARECFNVKPVKQPFDSASTCGVRLPWKWSKATKPSHPIGISSASLNISSYVQLNCSLNQFVIDPVLVCPPSTMNFASGTNAFSYAPNMPFPNMLFSVTAKCKCDEPVIKAIVLGCMAPNPTIPINASAPP
mmetsp:Transcript_10650/g.30267  ORF Transcript_10650/g.30267 Transcript_10650/m.30267 type:complete len:201 (+) Transcript_10650:1056-1658(+)